MDRATHDTPHEEPTHEVEPDNEKENLATLLAELEKSELTEEGLSAEDQAVFNMIKIAASLRDTKGMDGNRYWRVRDIVRDSRKHDVSYEVDRWLGGSLHSYRDIHDPQARNEHLAAHEVQRLIQPILRRGWIAEARNCLQAATPEGMRYGRPEHTSEKRIAEAKTWADKAGVSLHGIVDAFKMDLTLPE